MVLTHASGNSIEIDQWKKALQELQIENDKAGLEKQLMEVNAKIEAINKIESGVIER